MGYYIYIRRKDRYTQKGTENRYRNNMGCYIYMYEEQRGISAGLFLHMCVLCLLYVPSVPTDLPVLEKYFTFTIYSDNRQDG